MIPGAWPRPSAWVLASCALGLLWAWRSVGAALGDASVIQDDARQHVFWMLRFLDPELFEHDPVADYFQSLAPPAYYVLYWVLSLFLDPRDASKWVPLALTVLLSASTFGLIKRLSRASAGAFAASVLLTWYVWQHDDLASASPRAFMLPLLTLVLWCHARGSVWWTAGVAALGAALYPTTGAVAVAVVGMGTLRSWWHAMGDWRGAMSRLAPVVVAVGIVLVPAQLDASPWGPLVTNAQARTMPEFGPGGRNAFYSPDPVQFWLRSYRSGLDLRVSDARWPAVPLLAELGALALAFFAWRMTSRPAGQAGYAVLLDVAVASALLFLAAHALLFRLYLPSRFVQWTLPLVLSALAGVGLVGLLSALARRVVGGRAEALAACVLVTALALCPARFDGNLVRDAHPDVTDYLAALPPSVVVVGVPIDADSVPSFAARSVLMSREYALAYHVGYHQIARQRMADLVEAYYADSIAKVLDFAARHRVDVFLVNRAAFEASTVVDAWAGEFEPYTGQAVSRVRRGSRFALLELARRCAAVDDGHVVVVQTACIRAVAGSAEAAPTGIREARGG